MERPSRKAEPPAPKPPRFTPLEYHRRGTLKPNVVVKPKAELRYRRESSDDPYKAESRWYLMGAVFVAYMDVWKDYYRAGNYCVYINSRQGNTGEWFKTEAEAHNFIRKELEREPLP